MFTDETQLKKHCYSPSSLVKDSCANWVVDSTAYETGGGWATGSGVWCHSEEGVTLLFVGGWARTDGEDFPLDRNF